MNIKEFKTEWESKTLGELKAYINEKQDLLERMQNIVKEEAQKILDLDTTSKKYEGRLNDIANTIKSFSKDIKEVTKELEILNPILTVKELEETNQAEYEKYMTNNKDNIKVLIKTVEDDKQAWINEGGIIKVGNKEIELSTKEINEMYDTMLKELIWMIKDNAGNILEVNNLKMNGNRGFDCKIKGEKSSLNINTIVASGEVQRKHFRTLVQRY